MLAWGLGGCSSLTTPPAEARIEVPAAWAAGEALGASATTREPAEPALAWWAWRTWWASFGDAQMTFLIEQALQASPSLAQAESRLRQARARQDVSVAAIGAPVTATGSGRASRQEGLAATHSVSIGLDASWEPDLWGAVRADIRAASASVRGSQASLAGARLAIAGEVALQALQARGLQERLAIARLNLANQQQTVRIVGWRREAGLATDLDVQQALASAAQTEAQIPVLQTALRQAEHALATLTGQPAGSVWLTEGPQPRPPASLSLALPADVLRQRPDVAAAQAGVEAAAARVVQARASRLPSLALGGSIGLSALRGSSLGPGAGVASLAASVSLPIFDSGRREAQVRVQDAALDEARGAYRAAVLAALQDVEDNLVALARTQQQLGHLEAAATAAQAAARLAEQRYASGLVDFPTVLGAQRTQLAAEDARASGRTSFNTLHVRLFKALGGGWLPDEAPPPREPDETP